MNIVNTNVRRLPDELIERFRHVSPSELGHALEWGFMSNDIKILDNSKFTYIVGTAITARIPSTDSTFAYKAMTYAKPGDILVIDMQGEKRHAPWGEMTTRTAKLFGIAGVIVDGPNTDSEEIKSMDFPVFSKGQSNLTTKVQGWKGDVNVPVSVGGCVVMPGDLICANNDGIFVVPYDYADKLIEIAEMYTQYNIDDQHSFETNRPLTEFMSFDRKINAMEDVLYI